MKLNRINNTVFNAKIIDSHGHLGHWREGNNPIYDTTPSLDVFIKSNLNNGDTVEKVIVSNLDCVVNKSTDGKLEFFSDEIVGNKKILELCAKDSKLHPLAVCQPVNGSVDNIKTLFSENPKKFIGLKFHPEQMKLAANNNLYEPYMEFAQQKKLPCLFHSANSFDVSYPDGGIAKASTVSKPEQIYDLARKYKDVPVILAHWGGDGEQNLNKTTDLIIESVKKNDAKLYGDISWVDCNNPQKTNLKNIIERLKKENALDRILFGTDAPIGRFGGNGENGISPMKAYSDNVENIKNMIKREFPEEADNIIDKIFYKNANDLFFKASTSAKPPSGTKPPSGMNSRFFNKKYLGIAAGVLALGTGAYAFVKNKKAQEKENNKNLSLVV